MSFERKQPVTLLRWCLYGYLFTVRESGLWSLFRWHDGASLGWFLRERLQ